MPLGRSDRRLLKYVVYLDSTPPLNSRKPSQEQVRDDARLVHLERTACYVGLIPQNDPRDSIPSRAYRNSGIKANLNNEFGEASNSTRMNPDHLSGAQHVDGCHTRSDRGVPSLSFQHHHRRPGNTDPRNSQPSTHPGRHRLPHSTNPGKIVPKKPQFSAVLIPEIRCSRNRWLGNGVRASVVMSGTVAAGI